MIDWPGRIATSLFLSGCNLRCPYCHNPELLEAKCGPITWDGLLSHLASRRGWIDGVVITGGEPTSDPDIIPLLEEFAARGVRVKLDTNGAAPAVLAEIISSRLVEHVALDVKTFPERYDRLGDVSGGASLIECIDLVRSSNVSHEFRTTVYPPLITPEETPALASLLRGGDGYVLQQFKPDRALSADARSATPAPPLCLLAAAEECSRYLPTTTRGV